MLWLICVPRLNVIEFILHCWDEIVFLALGCCKTKRSSLIFIYFHREHCVQLWVSSSLRKELNRQLTLAKDIALFHETFTVFSCIFIATQL